MRRQLGPQFAITLLATSIASATAMAQTADPATVAEPVPALDSLGDEHELKAIAEIRERLGGGLSRQLDGLVPASDSNQVFWRELSRLSEDAQEPARRPMPESPKTPRPYPKTMAALTPSG